MCWSKGGCEVGRRGGRGLGLEGVGMAVGATRVVGDSFIISVLGNGNGCEWRWRLRGKLWWMLWLMLWLELGRHGAVQCWRRHQIGYLCLSEGGDQRFALRWRMFEFGLFP
jgi:hypothetical protein